MQASLSTKITLAVITLIAAGGILTGFIVHNNSTTALQKLISSNQNTEAKQTMDKIDRFLYERQVDMRSLSGRQQIQTYLAQSSQRTPANSTLIANQLTDFEISTGTWSDLTLLDTHGQLALPTNQPNLADLIIKRPTIQKLFSEALAGQTGYSDALSLHDNNGPVMLFMAPIRDSNSQDDPVVGILVGELAWQANIDILKDLKDKNANLINWQGISLGNNKFDAQNAVLQQNFSDTPIFKVTKKSTSGSGIFPGLDQPKNTFLSSYVKETGYLDFRGNSWTLVLETPKSVAYAPVAQLDKTLTATFSAIFIISTITILFVLRSLVLKPITNLKQVTGRLAKGDFSLRSTIKYGDEFGSLGQDFNDMADKIQEAYKSLTNSSESAQTEKHVIETILDNLPVGVTVVSAPDGKLIMMNKIGAQIVGRGLLSGTRDTRYAMVYDVIKDDGSPYPEDELPLKIALRTGEAVSKDDLIFRRPDGSHVPVRTMDAPIKGLDGQLLSVVSVFEDISKERALERSREEFFSIASHELRTPLTAIMGNSSLIQQYYGDKLPDDDAREMVSDIHESSLRLITIVNDFLDTSRLEQKHMKYEITEFNVIDIAKSVIKEYQVNGTQKNLVLEINELQLSLPMIRADKNRTKQILINLVGNAMKFTEEGKIDISFKIESKFIKVLISDTGSGMSEDAQKLLFRKFEQTGSTVLTRDSVRGTGLGLYISKLITEQMGGRIKLESSEPGVGTTFSFTLPIAEKEVT